MKAEDDGVLSLSTVNLRPEDISKGKHINECLWKGVDSGGQRVDGCLPKTP